MTEQTEQLEQTELAELFPDLNLEDVTDQEVALYLVPERPIKASAALRNSMARRGQLQPVLLNAGAGKEQYGVIDGRRRIAAARELGWASIRAYVIEADPLVEATLAVTANAVRGANPVSDLQAIHELVAAGYSERDIAQATGLAIGTVRKRMKLERLDRTLFNGLVAGKVAVGVAERVASLPATAQTQLAGILRERGRITGEDVHAVNSVGITQAVAGMDDLFAALPEPAALPAVAGEAGADPVLADITDAMRDVLRSYRGVVDLAAWCECAERAWDEEQGHG